MERRPNILFIQSDQHARRIAGCYGDDIVSTPNLDRLAERGVVFDNAYCASPICLPSRMSLLTARQPHNQQCWHNSDILRSDIPTYPQALGAAGYKPVLVGRLHSLGPDQMRGFVERLVGDHHPNWPRKTTHTMGSLGKAQASGLESLVNSGAGHNSYDRHAVEIAEAACERLKAIASADESEPFAMTVSFMLPHNPYVARAQDYARYEGRVGPARLAPAADEHPSISKWREMTRIAEASDDDLMRCRVAYYANVTRTDELIGQVLDTLEATGLNENTLVVYVSDHGEMLGERGLFWKSVFFEEAVGVPLIVSWPGNLPEGERRGQVVNLIDVTATILDAASAPPLPNSDGRSFLSVARDGSQPWIDVTYSEYCTEGFLSWLGTEPKLQRMVRFGDWKLVYHHGMPLQLFNLADDPDEVNDLADIEAHASLRDRLLDLVLSDWNPQEIAGFMARRVKEKALISAWLDATNPPDVHRWHLDQDENWLVGRDGT